MSERDIAAISPIVQYLLLAVLSVGLVASLWCVEYIPTNDGPNVIVQGYLEVHLDDPDKGYASFVERGTALTSIAFHRMFSVLVRFMPWRDAFRTTLSLGALLWAWGFTQLAWTMHRRRFALGIFGFATALSWPFYMGFFNFWIASGFALVVLSFGIRSDHWDRSRLAVLGAGTLLVGLSHVFVSLVLGLCLLGLALSRGQGKERFRSAFWLGVACLPVLLLAALVATAPPSVDTVSEAIVKHPFRPTWLDPGERLMLPWTCFTTGPFWRGLPIVFLALAGLTIAGRRAARHELQPAEMALGSVALVLLLLALGLPFHIESWKFLSPRFLPVALAIGLVLIPLERVARPSMFAGYLVGASIFALSAIGWSAQHHRRLVQHDADTLAGIRAPLRRTGARLPIRLRPPLSGVAYADQGLNLGHLYILEQGGMVPYLFATRPAIHPYIYRAKRRDLFGAIPGRFYRHLYERAGSSRAFPPAPVQLTSLAERGATYEDVILMGKAEEVDAFIERGYVVDFRRGGVAILHYVGCGLEVEVARDPERDTPIFVEYGWAPIVSAGQRRVARPGRQPSDARLRASFPRAPCGNVWIRVAWDTDRSGDLSNEDYYYGGKGPWGLILEEVTAEHNVLYLDGRSNRNKDANFK